MKSSGQISKPFLAIVFASLAVIGIILWFGSWHRGASKLQGETLSQTETNSDSTVADNSETSTPSPLENGELPPVIPIPLTNVLISAENGSWLKDKDYLRAPHSPQEFGGVEFLMDGMLQLQGRLSKEWKNYSYRTSIAIPLTLTNKIGSVHLLGGTRYGTDTKTFAKIVWHYTDGTLQRTPIDHLTHFRDWVRNPYEQPAHLPYPFAKVVWSMPRTNQPGQALRLYRTTFQNPAPKKIIKQLEFVSDMEDPTLFIVGVTLDPLKPGERPDNSADLEPTDPFPPKRIQITVQDLKGAPLPQSKLQVQFRQQNGKNETRLTTSLNTDANGVAEVAYPPEYLNRLDISASHDDYGGRKMAWDLSGGDIVPANYTLKLSSDVKIGGIVVDQFDLPVAGANARLYRFWRGNDDSPDKKGDQADFVSQTATTDADGRWQAKGLPPEMLDHIGFDVKHPDFIGTNYNVSGYEEQLRAGTFKIVLTRGLDARGLVVDENSNPISGATVWSGKRYYRDRQQTKSDSNGQFTFRNVTEGDVLFAVMAKGFSPENKTIDIHAGMAQIVFRLKAGNIVRAHVQNEIGEALSNTRVSLEGGHGEAAQDSYEFSANTDSQGNFTWDSAPEDPMTFYFYHDGYEQKRDVKLAPNQDNTVTLRHTRQLQGVVLDESTGQPVTKFSVRTGHHSSDESDIYGVIRNKEFNSPDGKFTMDLDEEEDNAVAVYAEGYADKIENFPQAQSSPVQVTVRLTPSETLSGIVLAPDGTPAPGVNVAVASENPRHSVQLSGTHLQSYDSHSKMATTDSEGRFKISSASEDGTVVAAGELGFAKLPLAQVRNNGTISLQQWGRIEGTMKIAGEPAPGKELLVSFQDSVISTDFNGFKRTTDDKGAFTFEKVPPGDISIVRLVKTTPNSWTHSYGKNVYVAPGQTVQVALGDDGAVIKGSVRFETPPEDEQSLTISGNLFLILSRPSFNTPEESQAFYNSSEGKELAKQQRNFALLVKPDKTFLIDSVPPGTYTLNISAGKKGEQPYMLKSVAQGQTTVTVPDDASPTSPISIGEILLKQMPQQ
jgi:uncharacterized GH25 family protein